MRFFIFTLFNILCHFLIFKNVDSINDKSIDFYLYRQKRSNYRIYLPPRIVNDLPPSCKTVSEHCLLKCVATGYPAPKIKWYQYRNDANSFAEVVESNKLILNADGTLQVTISQIAEIFYCQARNVLGVDRSKKIVVQKGHIIRDVSISYESMEVSVNQKAVIRCETSPKFYTKEYDLKYWEIRYKSGKKKLQQISNTKGRFSVIKGIIPLQLHIRNVTEDDFDDMQVRCVLVNIYPPNEMIDNDIWTNPKKSFYQSTNKDEVTNTICQNAEIRVIKGSSIELPWCSKPSTIPIFWYKTDFVTNLRRRINFMVTKIELISETYGNLLINNIDIPDEGLYTPKGKLSNLNYPTYTVRVMVNVTVEIKPKEVFVPIEKTVTLECITTGYPIPTISWLHNGREFHDYKPPERISNKSLMSTIIINVTIESAGVYQCLAESRDVNENRVLSENQQSVAVVISKMAPKLIFQEPRITPGLSYSIVTLKTEISKFEIQCRFNSVPKSTIAWFLDDEKIPIVNALLPNSTDLEPYTADAKLVIDLGKLGSIGDKWKYGGEYRAEVTNKYGKAYCTTLVFVSGVYKIRETNKATWVHGEKMTLKCYVISGTMPQIEWFRISEGNKIRLPATHYEKVIKGGREFTVPKLDKVMHSGTYMCRSTLVNDVISKEFTITITKPPTVLETSVDQIAFTPSSTKFTSVCRPKNNPDSPWYAWWEYIRPSNNNESEPINSNGNSKLFEIRYTEPLSKSANISAKEKLVEGVPKFLKSYNTPAQITIWYNEKLHLSSVRCVVKNHAGVIDKTIPITVVNLVFAIPPPSDLSVVLGESFALNCMAKPNQMNLKTTWINGDSEMQEPVNTTTSSRIHQLPNGTLVVKNIKLTDSNKFMCIIKLNNKENEISKVVKISIKVPAEILPMPDTVDLKKNSQDSLNCTVRGDTEKLLVHWFHKVDNKWDLNYKEKYEQKDKYTRAYIEFNGVNEEDSGEYKCEAKNEHQKVPVERIIWLNIVDVPGRIRDYERNIVNYDRSIGVSWIPPKNNGNKTITGYVVKWKLTNDNQSLEEIVKYPNITIKKLRPFQSYKIEISAINSVGVGEPVHFPTKTLAAAPEGKVLRLQADSMSSTSVKLSWDPPDELLINGHQKYYQVCLLEKDKNQTSDLLDWPPPNDTTTRIFDSNKHRIKKSCTPVEKSTLKISTTIRELLIFTEFAFRVILVNEIGYGPAAYTTTRTMEDYPEGYPTQIVCTTKENLIELEWNPPSQVLINGLVTGYEILYFRTDKNGEPDNIVNHALITTHSLLNVLPNTSYTIQVRVQNSKGFGPPSEPINCTTKEAAPEAPSQVRAYFINDICAKVTWTPPNNSNGIVRHYIMDTFKNSKRINTKQPSAATSNSYFSFTLCELTKSDDYEIEVKAVTIKVGPPNRKSILGVDKGILSFSRNIVAHNQKSIELECETIPTDDNMMAWTLNDKDIELYSNLKKLNNGSLIIHQLSEELQGIYKCTYGNDFVTYNVSLKSIHHVPWQPEIEFHKESANNIYLAWRSKGSPKSEDPINLFVISIYKNNITFVKSLNIPSLVRFTNISDLECGSFYRIDLFARNNYGNSSAHMIFTRTRGTKPEIPNTADLVIGNYSDSFCFNLTTFLPGQGCPAKWFKLKLTPSNMRYNSQYSDEINKSVDHKDLIRIPCFNVTGLHPYTGYDYQIEASNEVGSTTAEGYIMTSHSTSNISPKIITTNTPTNDNIIYFVIVPIVAIVVVIVVVSLIWCMHSSRSTNERSLQHDAINKNKNNNNKNINNNKNNIVQSPTSVSTNRNRKLPTPPGNHVYDQGKAENVKTTNNDDEDEMLVPYATYESIPKPDSNASRERPNLSTYLTGSQGHSYQYPDMLNTETASGSKPLYENESKQPLLIPPLKHRPYDKGYSQGSQTMSSLRPQIVRSNAPAANQKPRGPAIMSVAPGQADSEAYRPSSSLCSSTTESSTKDELREVFRNQPSTQFFSRLQETDEDGASTARGGNRSTIINRTGHMNTLSDDFTQPESYCESGSSGDDCGIRNFTQDPPGQQVIAPTIIRKINPKTNSMSYDTANRRPLIQQSNNFTLQQPRNPLPEEDEEESNNYTNNFVVV